MSQSHRKKAPLKKELIAQVEELRSANQQLIKDYQVLLKQYQGLEEQLQKEITERQSVEAQLRQELEKALSDKANLQIELEVSVSHGDAVESQLQEDVALARSAAYLDGLTQIANRRKFDEYLPKMWSQMIREQTPISLLMCDVDYFKLYNDFYGHLAGDHCLQQIAKVLAKAVKRPLDLVARYGGEEFVGILPNTTSQGSLQVCQQIQADLATLKLPHLRSPVSEFVTLSMGLATTIPSQGSPWNILITSADQALYRAKSQGRNQVFATTFVSRLIG
ncbi:MAG: diguanylate cyclase [Cyanobacteriota bacterium]|nr:diguanylate cyclase [Cyanobacteriota bacterium]